ncbi:MAG: hypothetical protein JST67_11725 [Bacteroidetes bacterium]|nr:hypothetical protein [Bacteroidota bacterium]
MQKATTKTNQKLLFFAQGCTTTATKLLVRAFRGRLPHYFLGTTNYQKNSA